MSFPGFLSMQFLLIIYDFNRNPSNDGAAPALLRRKKSVAPEGFPTMVPPLRQKKNDIP
jgi:hypothetical protein